MAPRRLISVHHRLTGRTGHRFQEALGLLALAPSRGFDLRLFIHREAEPVVRAALPDARAVLHDPVLRPDLSFDERTREFTAMLHRHVDAEVRRDDHVLMTVATQCETRAFAAWLRELPDAQKPWVTFLFHSDRWNRRDQAEYRRQAAEFALVRAELATLAPGDGARLRFGAGTPGLARELEGLLGVPVGTSPLTQVYDEIARATGGAPPRDPPCIGFLGGARTEKGSHLIRPIIAACRQRTRARFLVQLANEQLEPDGWAELERVAGDPGVEVVRGGLSPEVYARLLARCDVLPFPYHLASYRQRTSGIVADAIAAAKVVVVPRGIWIATLVAGGEAAGVLYDGEDPADVAAAVHEAIRRLPELRTRARACVTPWVARQSLSAFLDWATVPGRGPGHDHGS